MTSPILWQNDAKDITLIDVPRSIAHAQGTIERPCLDELLTARPLEAPFVSNEPKSGKARAKLRADSVEEALHAEYQTLLARALRKTKETFFGRWCIERHHVAADAPERPSGKRKFIEEADRKAEVASQELSSQFLADLVYSNGHIYSHFEESSAHVLTQSLKGEDEGEGFSFKIPPGCTYLLGDCSTTVRAMHEHVISDAWDRDPRGQFDFILLDPPWPNRSVKRTHKTPGSSYSTLATLDDVYDLLAGMKLDRLMADGCLVGIWITNKSAVRDLVLGEDGFFDLWGLELVEEWIWLKTTAMGEPVTPLDGLWRKPYEVLLLARKPSTNSVDGSPEVQRRVLMSVPDLHSRKPCLKTLIESMLTRTHYRALEVFARHMVSGWWSWGNECIKFNWEGYWREGPK